MPGGVSSDEPMDEALEVGWMLQLDRFDKVIYPLLFESRGYTKGEAFLVWRMGRVEDALDEVRQELADRDKPF